MIPGLPKVLESDPWPGCAGPPFVRIPRRARWPHAACNSGVNSDKGSGVSAGMSQETVQSYMLWIDGVGSWLVVCGRSVVLGGAVESSAADIRLMAPMSRRHAEFEQSDEGWTMRVPGTGEANAGAGAGAQRATMLTSGQVLEFPGRVQLEFRVPNVLSVSAVLVPEAPQRLVPYADGIVLLADRMLIGPRRDAHICCPQLSDQFVFYLREGRMCCRSAGRFMVNGTDVEQVVELCDGDVIVSGEFRVRIEDVAVREVG